MRWDGKPARSYGGIAAGVVAYSREHGIPVRVICRPAHSATKARVAAPD
jgi:hypothetical protein